MEDDNHVSRDANKMIDDAFSMGNANLKIIELAQRYCLDMEFVPTGGVGMIEEQTGLPIGRRRIKCPVANGRGEAMNLEWVASEFYDENCTKCLQRRPTKLLPNLGTFFEEKKNVTVAQIVEKEKRLTQLRVEWGQRRQYRDSLEITLTQTMVSALRDMDVLDGDPSVRLQEKELQAAERRLSALAERAPSQFTPNIVSLAVNLVLNEGITRLLTPLRHLGSLRSEFAPQICSAALKVLSEDANLAAGQCLVDLAAYINETELNDSIVISLILLAGSPRDEEFGNLAQSKVANDPSGLRVLADLVPAFVTNVLEKMLPKPVNDLSLILPDGVQSSEGTDTDYYFASAAGAIGELAITHPGIVENLVPHVLRSLTSQSYDPFGFHPDYTAVKTLAKLAVMGIGDVIPHIERHGINAGKEFRESMMDVYRKVVDLLDPHNRWRTAGDPQPEASISNALYEQVFEISMMRLTGDWDHDQRIPASELIEQLAEVDPGKAFLNISSILGSVLLLQQEYEKKKTPSLLVSTPKPEALIALEELGRKQGISIASSKLLNAIALAAEVNPAATCQTIVRLIKEERDLGKKNDPRSNFISSLGKIGEQHGSQPEVLQIILPVLHSYIVDNAVINRSSALDAWHDIAQRHELPSSLNSLLPVLLTDTYLVVMQAILRLARHIPWSDNERADLLSYSRLILSIDTNEETLKEAIYSALSLARRDERLLAVVEMEVIRAAAKLNNYDLHRVLQANWLSSTKSSPEMAQLCLKQAADPAINDSFNSRESEQLNALLECGIGLNHLSRSDLLKAALEFAPDSPLASAEFAEVAVRANRLGEAKAITEGVLAKIPDLQSFSFQNRLAKFLDANVAVDLAVSIDDSWDDAMQNLAEVVDLFDSGDKAWVVNLLWQSRVRTTVRYLLVDRIPDTRLRLEGISFENEGQSGMFSTAQNRIVQLSAAINALGTQSDFATPTGTFIRGFAKVCEIGVQLLKLGEAILNADVGTISALSTAILTKAKLINAELAMDFRNDDPLASLLITELTEITNVRDYDQIQVTLERLASIPLPLLIIRGKRKNNSYNSAILSEDADLPDHSSVAVVLASIDGKLITGPSVLRPNHVYQLSVEVFTDPWPGWVSQLDIELLSVLSENELTRPAFIWRRGDNQDKEIATGNKSHQQSGTLIVRFSLTGGMTPQPVLMKASWRGDKDGRPFTQSLEVTGHHELKVRPFDSSTDFLTDYLVFDERLVELYTRLNNSNFDLVQVQAFCRLLTAISRVGLRMTWDKEYKRGTRVTERQFHNHLHARLLEESELEGRVERGNPLALGFLDVRHDGITAELKVERRTPVTRESAVKYIGQPTQYAAADGSRISILAILDLSPKELPPGTPENYLFVLPPKLHGLSNPEAPSLVACLIINGNLPTPSSWSGRRIPIE